jgi:hypothetical protein
MKTLVIVAVIAFAGLLWLGSGDSNRTASGCPGVDQNVIWLPADRQGDRAVLLNAADVLNNRMGACVIGGGWGQQTGMYFLSVQEPGKPPENRRYTLDALEKLAKLGER